MNKPLCNVRKAPLEHTFVDLGMAPVFSTYLPEEALQKPQMQKTPEQVVGNHHYLSFHSKRWLLHAKTADEVVKDMNWPPYAGHC